jgi:hypothetical protein
MPSEIQLIQLADRFYVHTSWYDFPGLGRFPSNGLRLYAFPLLFQDIPEISPGPGRF